MISQYVITDSNIVDLISNMFWNNLCLLLCYSRAIVSNTIYTCMYFCLWVLYLHQKEKQTSTIHNLSSISYLYFKHINLSNLIPLNRVNSFPNTFTWFPREDNPQPSLSMNAILSHFNSGNNWLDYAQIDSSGIRVMGINLCNSWSCTYFKAKIMVIHWAGMNVGNSLKLSRDRRNKSRVDNIVVPALFVIHYKERDRNKIEESEFPKFRVIIGYFLIYVFSHTLADVEQPYTHG